LRFTSLSLSNTLERHNMDMEQYKLKHKYILIIRFDLSIIK